MRAYLHAQKSSELAGFAGGWRRTPARRQSYHRIARHRALQAFLAAFRTAGLRVSGAIVNSAANRLPSREIGMRLAIIFVGIAMGISGSTFAGQAHEPATASTAAVAETPADPCSATETADHAISEKGHGTAGRMVMSAESLAPVAAKHAINTKGTGGNRMSTNAEGDTPAPADHAINTKGTGCNNG